MMTAAAVVAETVAVITETLEEEAVITAEPLAAEEVAMAEQSA
jgi:hypothetical protein